MSKAVAATTAVAATRPEIVRKKPSSVTLPSVHDPLTAVPCVRGVTKPNVLPEAWVYNSTAVAQTISCHDRSGGWVL